MQSDEISHTISIALRTRVDLLDISRLLYWRNCSISLIFSLASSASKLEKRIVWSEMMRSGSSSASNMLMAEDAYSAMWWAINKR